MAPIATYTTSHGFLPVYDTYNRVKTSDTYTNRAYETADLLQATQDLLIPFIASADQKFSGESIRLNRDVPNGLTKRQSDPPKHLSLANKRNARNGLGGSDDTNPSSTSHEIAFNLIGPKELIDRLGLQLPEEASGKDGLLDLLSRILKYSVNTWNPGFMHKLYATTNPIGVVSELILAVLNTNLHVYKVSPALSVIERITSQKLANAFGLTGPHAGGGTHPGGSASNLAALVIARNTAFPAIRHKGNNGRNLVVFTSQDSHYSITKAAQTCGIGAKNVWTVPVDPHGRMRSDDLVNLLREARLQGLEPFFVNATAGTTVLGACDPLHDIADICHKQGLWMHVDASWGGGAIFSDSHRHKLAGIERAHSITTNPHKMLGVPVTCSFLLARDMRVVWRANRFEAGYLFHERVSDAEGKEEEGDGEVSWDLADATLQCGRKGDSLKLALSWVYQGRAGLGRYVDAGFDNASYLAQLVREQRDLILVSPFPPPCLQVCFYHQPDGSGELESLFPAEEVTEHTKSICDRLVGRGFMVDFAPGPGGSFLRVVVNGCTTRATLERLVDTVVTMDRKM